MTVNFNGETIQTNQHTLYDILEDKNLSEKTGIAIAVNNSVVSKVEWKSKKIKENDNILIITATQGG